MTDLQILKIVGMFLGLGTLYFGVSFWALWQFTDFVVKLLKP